jgi:hypothetical protein
MAKRLTYFILIALVAGIVVGYGLHQAFDAKDPALATIADILKLLPDVFLRLIKMIIAPLIMATIVTGIAGMGDPPLWAGSAPRRWCGLSPPAWCRCCWAWCWSICSSRGRASR